MPKTSNNKRHEVARLLERAILQGHLKPGTRLPAEIKIARVLGVSQASVREALQDLESQGLIVGYQNRSSYVIELKTPDLVHIYQVRSELEPLACALAAQEFTSETADALQDCINAMRTAAAAQDFRAYSSADLTFHHRIWQAQPNRPLEKMLLLLCQPLFAYDLVLRYGNPKVDYQRIERQHALLLMGLHTGNPKRVRRLTRWLILRWMKQDIADFDQILAHGATTYTPRADALHVLEMLSTAQHTATVAPLSK